MKATLIVFVIGWLAASSWSGISAEPTRLDSGCVKPETPEHGEMFVLWSGLLVQFRCTGDYKLAGPAAIICRNRTWTQEPPVCLDEHQLAELRSVADAEEAADRDDTTDDGATTRLNSRHSVPMSDEAKKKKDAKGGGGGNKNNNNNNKNGKANKKDEKTEGKKASKSNHGADNNKKNNKGKNNKQPKAEGRNVNEIEAAATPTDAAAAADDDDAQQVLPVDFASLDQSCLSETDTNQNSPVVAAPSVPNGAGIKYIRRRNKSSAGNRYAAAVYTCAPGYMFVVPDADRLYCRQGRWIGPSPICILAPEDANENSNALSEVDESAAPSASGSACGEDKGGCEHICDDSTGRAACLCYRGYTLSPDGYSCIDIDECATDNGGCEGQCVNRQGSYQCFCSDGFRLASNGKKCIDHNECLLRNGHGPCQGTCTNTYGSYKCSCDGRPGTQLAADGHSCEDVDECGLGDNFGCSHTCLNTLGTAFCTCPDGYMLGEDWKTCEDMNECELEDVGQACAGTCINTIGSYRCSEEDGSASSEDFNDYDEEKEAEAIVVPSTTTTSTTTTTTTTTTTEAPTTTTTEAPTTEATTTSTTTEVPATSSTSGGVASQPDDEEDEENAEDDGTEDAEEDDRPDDDDANEEDEDDERTKAAVATDGAKKPAERDPEPEIICPDGFARAAETEDGSPCLDVDECLADDNFGCSHICVNSEGSARCDCPAGWTLGTDRKTCEDVDECSAPDNFGCSDECVNTDGSAHCACPDGYAIHAADNKTCTDIDECSGAGDDATPPNFGCSHQCVNLPGGAECKCPSGYKLRADQKTCKDIDECAKDNGGCSHECVNLKGGMKCQCPAGYQLSDADGKTCVDVDECHDMDEGLSCRASGGTCTNTLGSFECVCPAGFRTVATICIDIDECAELSPCSMACTNLPGSYICDCEDGFENRNGTCVDIDECPTGVCNQLCTNIPGSYVCDCHPGYQLIGDVCQDIDECSGSTNPCDDTCRNTVGSFECLCADGFELDADGRCVDIDECLTDPCQGICINTQGSYSCSCELGYQLGENGTCTDIDECLSNPCPVECINSEGSYSCLCPTGYQYSIDENICKDVDECLGSPCGASATCVNTEGSYACECEAGFTLRGSACEDVDECKNNPCNGICINLPGSYQCICDPGYELRNGRCEDIDECLNYKCGGHCINLPGTYRCECDKGYRLEGDHCVDIDECITLKPCQGRCINMPGSFKCECDEGFRSERHECIDIDECSFRNGGCSHICENTIGSFRCACDPGFEVSNRNASLCHDVNECRTNNGGCSQDCINTRGSYHCACSDQYYLDSDGWTCVERPPRCPRIPPPDHGEVECTQNVDHPHLGYVEQDDEALLAETGRGDLGSSAWTASRSLKPRSLYNSGSTCVIRCNKGYKLVGDSTVSCDRTGHWLGEPATCIPLACPKLQAPENGYLVPHTCATGKTFPGQQCLVRCKAGHRLIGAASPYQCLPSQQWRTPDETPRCERVDSPVPFIQCPGNMAVSLPSHEKKAYVSFSQPKSNMDWFRYVDSEPLWAKQLGGELPVGLNAITFRVRSPVSDLKASCTFTIEVFDKEIPRMTNCPSSITVFLEPGQSSQIVTWNEPIFTDNVEVVQLNKSREPGELFQAGFHEIAYTAQDAAGNQAKCQFTIHVTNLNDKDIGSPITKVPRGRVLVRCPGSKPGKYLEMYTYKVPAGCIVINNPSALTRTTISTPAPRYKVFDWDFAGSPTSGSRSNDAGEQATGRPSSSAPGTKLTESVPRLRDAAPPSPPVIVPGPALVGNQAVRLGSGRLRKSRISTEHGLQPIPTAPSAGLWSASSSSNAVHAAARTQQTHQHNERFAYWCCDAPTPPQRAAQSILPVSNNHVYWPWEEGHASGDRTAANKNRHIKKQGGAVDLLTPFGMTTDNADMPLPVRPGRKRQHGPKHQPKPGPSLVTAHDRNKAKARKAKINTSTTPAPLNRRNKATLGAS